MDSTVCLVDVLGLPGLIPLVLCLSEPDCLDLDCPRFVVVALRVVLADLSVVLVLLKHLMLIGWHLLKEAVAAVVALVRVWLRFFLDPVALVEVLLMGLLWLVGLLVVVGWKLVKLHSAVLM